jgi:hypothetical protein
MYCLFRNFDFRCLSYSIADFYDFVGKDLSVKGKYYVYITSCDCKSNYIGFDYVTRRLDFIVFYLGSNSIDGANLLIGEITDFQRRLINSLGDDSCTYDCEGCFNMFNLHFIKVPHNSFMNNNIVNNFISKIFSMYVVFLERRYYR